MNLGGLCGLRCHDDLGERDGAEVHAEDRGEVRADCKDKMLVQKLRAEIASCRQVQKERKQQMGIEIYEHLLNNNQAMITEIFNRYHAEIVAQEQKIAEKKQAKAALKEKLGDKSKETGEYVAPAAPQQSHQPQQNYPPQQQMPPVQQMNYSPPAPQQQTGAPPPNPGAGVVRPPPNPGHARGPPPRSNSGGVRPGPPP